MFKHGNHDCLSTFKENTVLYFDCWNTEMASNVHRNVKTFYQQWFGIPFGFSTNFVTLPITFQVSLNLFSDKTHIEGSNILYSQVVDVSILRD